MALQAVIHNDKYSFYEAVNIMDSDTIQKSKELFEWYKQQGIIIAGEYEDRQWTMTDEVNKGMTISFQIDEVHFAQETAPKLACTCNDYKQAMRVIITSRFGYSLRTLQSDATFLRSFANEIDVPTDYTQAQLLADLLTLLPGHSKFREDLQYRIDDISPILHTNGQQRQLAHYQSYLRFSQFLDDYWKTAKTSEKVLYFPVWFWFSVTGVLPLRATECVLTPRNCITHTENGYFLEVRRSKKKGTRQETRYHIEQDYERRKYPIPKYLAIEILEYISATKEIYRSDIDVLFCKETQFAVAGVRIENNQYYSYANLKQCLSYFYRNIIQTKYGYTVTANRTRLDDGEIGVIHLGDMRHIAMVTLAVSGGSPSICKELAGHDSIEISAHYYSNLTTFLDLLGWERYREMKDSPKQAFGLMFSRQYPICNGYCQCEQVWNGDYRACESAVNAEGMPGSCEICKWYFPVKTQTKQQQNMTKEKIAEALNQTCTLLRCALEQLRQGCGYEDAISCILDRLAAQSRQYIHQTTAEWMNTEMEK